MQGLAVTPTVVSGKATSSASWFPLQHSYCSAVSSIILVTSSGSTHPLRPIVTGVVPWENSPILILSCMLCVQLSHAYSRCKHDWLSPSANPCSQVDASETAVWPISDQRETVRPSPCPGAGGGDFLSHCIERRQGVRSAAAADILLRPGRGWSDWEWVEGNVSCDTRG